MQIEVLPRPRVGHTLDMSDVDRQQMLLVLKAIRDARRILRAQGYRVQIRMRRQNFRHSGG
jgi:hypothetical protein